MMFLRKRFYCLFLFILAAYCAHADEVEFIKQKLLSQPPTELAERAQRYPDDPPIRVDYWRADMDGSGQFQFIIASYSGSGPGVYLRVFKQNGDELTLLGEPEEPDEYGGWGTTVDFVDINGDGIPELDLSGTGANGEQVFHQYFAWTGNSLHLLNSGKGNASAGDAGLADIDGDGWLELIIPRGDGKYNISNFNGTEYKFSKTVDHDPEGVVGPDGEIHLVRAFLTALRPPVVSLDAIKEANRNDKKENDGNDGEEGKIRLVMGKLQDLNGKTIPVEQVDTTTLVLGQNLHPIRAKIRPAQKEDGEQSVNHPGKNTAPSSILVLELEFSRREVLRLLPKLQLTGPLMPGDEIEIITHGKMKNGTHVSAVSSLLIRGDEDVDGKK